MLRKLMFVAATTAALSPALLGGTAVQAHNAGHIHTPSGNCVDVGSGKHAPTDNQDKIPGGGDQYGARWAAELTAPIFPRHCDEPGAHNHP